MYKVFRYPEPCDEESYCKARLNYAEIEAKSEEEAADYFCRGWPESFTVGVECGFCVSFYEYRSPEKPRFLSSVINCWAFNDAEMEDE